MIKKPLSIFAIFIIYTSLISCTEQISIPPTSIPAQTLKASTTHQPTNTIPSSLTPTITITPKPSYAVIQEQNVNDLEKIYEWDVDNLFNFGTTSFWLPDSNQFVLPIQKGSIGGIQSYGIDNFAETWFSNVDQPVPLTVDTDNAIITYLNGLHIFNGEGREIRTISTKDNCGKASAAYIIPRPKSNLIITGHQDSWSGGLNYDLGDKASLIKWDKTSNLCFNLVPLINGVLFSLSISPDGHYLGYSFGDRSEPSSRTYTKIIDLDSQKETCQLTGLFSVFNPQNHLAVYNVDDSTISFISPSDCREQDKLKLNDNVRIYTLSFSPSGELLAGTSKNSLIIWNIKSGTKVKEIDIAEYSIPIIGFSPDGRFLVIADNYDHKVILFGIQEK